MVFLVVMGVCGSGKTTIALELGQKLNCPVVDADDFHTEANKQKMSQSIPLTDEDRYPWLMAIHKHIDKELNKGRYGIIACSALKRKYRRILLTGTTDESLNSSLDQSLVFIYLKGSQVLIEERLTKRNGHFMSPNLLHSQLDILEEPNDSENCIVADISEKPSEIVRSVVNNLAKRSL